MKIHKDTSDPIITFDSTRCQNCELCEIYTQQIQGCYSLKKNKQQITPIGGIWANSTCTHCGGCVDVCQSGAISDIFSQNVQSDKNIQKVNTICPHCIAQCPITLHIKENKDIIGVKSREKLPAKDKKCNYIELPSPLCVIGRYSWDWKNHHSRLRSVKIKQKGKMISANLEEALTLAANEIINNCSEKNLAMIVGSNLPGDIILSATKFVRNVIKDNKIYLIPDVIRDTPKKYFITVREFAEFVRTNPQSIIINASNTPIKKTPILNTTIHNLITTHPKIINICKPNQANPIDFIQHTNFTEFSGRRCFIIFPADVFAENETKLLNIIEKLENEKVDFKFILDADQPNIIGLPDVLKGIKICKTKDLIEELINGNIGGIYTIGVDILSTLPGIIKLLPYIRNINVKIMHETFASQRMKFMSVVFPTRFWFEEDSFILDGEGNIQKIPKIFDPPTGTFSDDEIFEKLKVKLNKLHYTPKHQKTENRISINNTKELTPLTRYDFFGKLKIKISDNLYHHRNELFTWRSVIEKVCNFDSLRIHPDDGRRFDIGDGESAILLTKSGKVKCRVIYDNTLTPGFGEITNYFPTTYANILWDINQNLTDNIDVLVLPYRGYDTSAPTKDQRRCISFR